MIALALVGAVMEVVGVTLAFLEVRRRGTQLSSFQASLRNVTVFAEPVIVHVETHGSFREVRDREPTVEERLSSLELRLAEDVPEEIWRARDSAVARAEEKLRPAIDSAFRSAGHDLERVRTLLVESLSGNGRAYWSLGLIVGGLLIQTLGGVLGNLAAA